MKLQKELHRLKVYTTDHPLFSEMARMALPPEKDQNQTQFEAAYASFNIAEGTEVDLSYFYQPPLDDPWSSPRAIFDRHVRTEELWVVTEGDFILPMGLCDNPDDPDEQPNPEKMSCFIIRQGDVFVLKPNVWHCGPWSLKKGQSFKFYMALSGHRKSDTGDTVDHILKKFPEHVGIIPDVDEDGNPR